MDLISSTTEYIQKYNDSKELNKSIHENIINIGKIMEDHLPLRKCRLTYSQLTGSKYTEGRAPECYDSNHDEMFPIYLVKEKRNFVYEDGHVYLPVIGLMEDEQISKGLVPTERILKAPWTIVNMARYSVKDGIIHMQDGIGEASKDWSRFLLEAFKPAITAYTFDALKDITRYNAGDYYSSAYTCPEHNSISTGIFGVLHMNTLVNMNLDDDMNRPDMEMREFKDEQSHFLCAGHTPHSIEAGSIRRLAHGVEIRLWSATEWGRFVNCISRYTVRQESSDFLLLIEGSRVAISERSFVDLTNCFLLGYMACATMKVVDYFIHRRPGRAMCISVAPGVLIRRHQDWAYDSSTLSYWKATGYLKHKRTMGNCMSTYFSVVPFLRYDRPPRTLISSVQILQAMCHPHLYTSSIYIPKNESKPLVVTEFALDLLGEDTHLIPGENACILLMNLNDNYEDCFIMSSKCVEKEMFSYREVMTLSVDTQEEVKVGDKITMETHSWWYVPFHATVVSSKYDSKHRLLLTLSRDADITDGDKLATMHGQKGVVKILPAEELPYGIDDEGNRVEFDIIISISSVISRLTVGQVLELHAGRIATSEGRQITCEEYHSMNLRNGSDITDTFPIKVFNPKSGLPYLRKNVYGSVSEIMCEWGYGRVSMLKHLTINKHHFTRIESNKYTKYAPSGRTKGGSVKIGDMEMQALASSGLTHTLQELMMRRDMSKVNVCVKCNRQCMLCTCGEEHCMTRSMLIPYSTLCFDTVCAITEERSFEYLP
jgi:hypothetical protein